MDHGAPGQSDTLYTVFSDLSPPSPSFSSLELWLENQGVRDEGSINSNGTDSSTNAVRGSESPGSGYSSSDDVFEPPGVIKRGSSMDCNIPEFSGDVPGSKKNRSNSMDCLPILFQSGADPEDLRDRDVQTSHSSVRNTPRRYPLRVRKAVDRFVQDETVLDDVDTEAEIRELDERLARKRMTLVRRNAFCLDRETAATVRRNLAEVFGRSRTISIIETSDEDMSDEETAEDRAFVKDSESSSGSSDSSSDEDVLDDTDWSSDESDENITESLSKTSSGRGLFSTSSSSSSSSSLSSDSDSDSDTVKTLVARPPRLVTLKRKHGADTDGPTPPEHPRDAFTQFFPPDFYERSPGSFCGLGSDIC
uniref:ORF21 n=1 Tax=Latid herpesvirus 1 TaxID=3096545 RepID=A0AB33V6I6_9VIRU